MNHLMLDVIVKDKQMDGSPNPCCLCIPFVSTNQFGQEQNKAIREGILEANL